MKTIALYANRNTGMICLLYLVAKGYNVKLICNDYDILQLEPYLNVKGVTFNTMGDFDLFICCHGTRILSKELLEEGRRKGAEFVNIHPCLSIGLKGKDPISRFIAGKMTYGSVDSHYMIEKVDEGEIIRSEKFTTPLCYTHADFYNEAYKHYISVLQKTLERLGL